MRIVCPSCAAAYEVPDTRVLPGQSVRCARCGTNWTPVAEPLTVPKPFGPLLPPIDAGSSPTGSPPIAKSASPSPAAQIFSPPDAYAATLDRPGISLAASSAVLIGWILSVAIIIGFCWAAIAWRDDIMHAWPPSERLYSTLGLPAER